ncbi:MAG: hypothetical protein PF440_03010 [Thiomicrorhabdus sp.]|nr:hypothetical protein [Thiomicrorhabdus sp.]
MKKLYNVVVKEWFDKQNGNSYNSVRISSNVTGDLLTALPIGYGYGDGGEQRASEWLRKHRPTLKMKYLRERASITKIENCKKRMVKDFGKA